MRPIGQTTDGLFLLVTVNAQAKNDYKGNWLQIYKLIPVLQSLWKEMGVSKTWAHFIFPVFT